MRLFHFLFLVFLTVEDFLTLDLPPIDYLNYSGISLIPKLG